jgi:hypothetical protein
MPKKKPDRETLPPAETAERFERALQNALNTPPDAPRKKTGRKPKQRKKRQRPRS